MTKYLWCSDRKTGSPACCFNSVPSEQQDGGSVSAASERAAPLAGYHHKINPQVSSWLTDCSSDRMLECDWQKLPLITLLRSWNELSARPDCPLRALSSIINFVLYILHWNTQVHTGKLTNPWPWTAKCNYSKWIVGKSDGCAFHPQLSLINYCKVTTRGMEWSRCQGDNCNTPRVTTAKRWTNKKFPEARGCCEISQNGHIGLGKMDNLEGRMNLMCTTHQYRRKQNCAIIIEIKNTVLPSVLFFLSSVLLAVS